MHRHGRGFGASWVALPAQLVEQHDRRIAGCDRGELLVGDQKARAGIADDVADFVGGEAIVDGKNTAPMWLAANTSSRNAALFFISTATTSSAPIAARRQPAGDLADAFVEGGIGDIFAAVFQRTAIWCAPGMKGDEAGKIDHSPPTGRFKALLG